MATPVESRPAVESRSFVPEAPTVGLGGAPVAERTAVVGGSTVEPVVGGIKQAAVETPVLGAQPVGPVARERTPAPVVK